MPTIWPMIGVIIDQVRLRLDHQDVVDRAAVAELASRRAAGSHGGLRTASSKAITCTSTSPVSCR